MHVKTTTKVAFSNMKYYKSRNLLIGIAIVLTTMLLFVIPTVGKGMLDLQFAAVNKLYPTWHALYRNVDEPTVRQLAVHHDIARYGLRSDAGAMSFEDANVPLLYMDAVGADLYRVELDAGTLPQEEDDIVVSDGILKALGQSGKIGDTIRVPYQILRDGALDFTETKEFRICGLIADSKESNEKKSYIALISKSFLIKELESAPITYRFLFQINDATKNTTEDIQQAIQTIADQFGITENDTNINTEYLGANYVDPVYVPAILIIMGIIMLAGIITIYSIYYVSMNQKIQEFGKLKAIGATKRQIKQLVLREGLCTAFFAIPLGLLIGSALIKMILKLLFQFSKDSSSFIETVAVLIDTGEVSFFYWQIYLAAVIVALCTVYFSLLRPMRLASKISEIEAIRVHGTGTKTRASRKGYSYLTIGRLAMRNLSDNRKKSLLTILSMSMTGIFLMIVATVLSCANPTESANSSLVGEYELSPIIENHNKEHPERTWAEVQKNNPLSSSLKKQVESLPGVEKVDVFTTVHVSGSPFDPEDYQLINGVPQEYADELEKGIQQGSVTYEDLKSTDKVIADYSLLHWYPDLAIGDKLMLTVYDGDDSYEKEFEIAAIGNYRNGLTNYALLIMAKEAADQLCKHDSSTYFHIQADKKYDKALETSLQEIVTQSGRLELRTWNQEYKTWKSAIALTSGACYAFLGILAVISVMNLINTMINSVHVRKKELGILQAIGMSDTQFMKMLQLEGLFYTAGTLLLSVGVGSLAGYPIFVYAKNHGMFNIQTYHYPVTAAIIVSASLLCIQLILAVGIGKSVKQESLIERIRFSE